MEKTLNWGLLSTAKINRALMRPLRASRRTRLLAVASRDRSTAEAYARRHRIPRAYGSYEALLEDPQVDVIYNSLPNHLHAEWTIKALQAGKHVLCEKPLALSLGEVDAMISASRQAGRALAEAFMYRHHEQTLKVKQLVDGGRLGKLQLIRGSFSFRLTRPGNYRSVKEMGGGSLWDVGCYPISFARMLTGERPAEVFGWAAYGAGGADESFAGGMRFPGGALCLFDCSFVSPLRTSVEIVGSEASLTMNEPFKPGVANRLILRRDGKEQRIKVRGRELYLGEVLDLCDAVQKGRPPRVSLEDSRENVETILSLIESAEAKRPVYLTNPVG